MKKKNLKNKNGITLIALVVTIVVLLILAGVSISMLTGENGIITQAQESKENTRGGEVKEYVELVANENKMVDYATGTKKEKQDVIDELVTDKKLTEEEVELLKTEDIITIGDIEIDFSILGETETGKTIGDIYSEELVGKTINYTSDTALPEETEWIILGEDKDGSIMLTTSKPIENGYEVIATAERWLSYEEDLHEACSIYGTTVQGKEVIARSMTLNDIFRVIGVGEPPLGYYNEYTFGDTLNLDNNQVDFWHPDKNGTATENDGSEYSNYKFWSKEETTFEDNWSEFFLDEYWWGMELKNIELIGGENLDFNYALASRTQRFKLDGCYVQYYGCYVSGRRFGNDTYSIHFCTGSQDSFSDKYEGWNAYEIAVRPIINLPSDIQVEELNGEWSIIN